MSTTEAGAIYEGRDLEALSDMPNYYAWIMQWFAPFVHGETVEYGAGVGTVSALLRARTETLTLVEPSANLNSRLRRRFELDACVSVTDEMLEEHIRTLGDESVDTIVLVNVLEHIEDDVVALEQFRRVLRPGGYLLLFVPALSALMSNLDRVFGHYRRYHRGALRAQLSAAGFEVRESRYFDLVGVAPWFLFNTLMGSKNLSPAMLRIYDRAVVPVARLVEHSLPPPLGKNIVAIARKSA